MPFVKRHGYFYYVVSLVHTVIHKRLSNIHIVPSRMQREGAINLECESLRAPHCKYQLYQDDISRTALQK